MFGHSPTAFSLRLRKAIDALTLKWCLAARWCAAPIKAASEFLVDDDIRGLYDDHRILYPLVNKLTNMFGGLYYEDFVGSKFTLYD